MDYKVNLWSPNGLLEIKTKDAQLLIKHMGWEEKSELSSTDSPTFDYDGSLPKRYRVGSPETVRYFVGRAMREKWGVYLTTGLFIAPTHVKEPGVPFFPSCEEWKRESIRKNTLKLLNSSMKWYKAFYKEEEELAKGWADELLKFLG